MDEGAAADLPTSTYTLEAEVQPSSSVGSGGIVGWGAYGSSNQVFPCAFNYRYVLTTSLNIPGGLPITAPPPAMEMDQ